MKRLIVLLLLLMLAAYPASAAVNNTFSILLIGTDDFGYMTVPSATKMSRADAIYLLSLGGNSTQARILSIERDYLVELPDGKGKNKLATATFFGGPQLCVDEVNQLFDLNIQYYAQINIENAIQAIDLLGGVEIDIAPEEVEPVNYFIAGMLSMPNLERVRAGVNRLNGHQTWAFMSVRDLEGDPIKSNAGRNARHLRVVKACIKQFQQIEFAAAVKLLDQVLPMLQTNLPMGDLIGLVPLVRSTDITQTAYLRTPTTPYQIKMVGVHKVVVVDNMQAEKDTIQRFLLQ